jgi:Domain of unknown function (DUF4214)
MSKQQNVVHIILGVLVTLTSVAAAVSAQVTNIRNAGALGLSPCTNATVKGTYGFQRNGTTSQGALTALGTVVWDGDGNDVAQQTISRSGKFTDGTNQISTYNINPDCTGTLYNLDASAFGKFTVVHNGSEIIGMSLTAGNNVVIHNERITDSGMSATGTPTQDAQVFINRPNAQNAEAGGFSGCTNASVKGTYGSQRNGTTNQVPLSAVGMTEFDGEGKAVTEETISRAGNFSGATNQVSTYKINPDCTGTESDSSGNLIAKIIVVHDGSQIIGMSLTPGDNMSLHFERITDSETSASGNPIDDTQFFVRQQYLDFLNREPDADGLAYWTNQIAQCGSDAHCIHERRIGVSDAFFVEQEFQQTGDVVYRAYRAAYGTMPNAPTRANLTFAQFMADRAQLVGGPGLPQSTIDFANNFVARAEFKQAYPDAISQPDFVNQLFNTAGLFSSPDQRQAEIDALLNGSKTRAQVLLDVIDIPEFKDREYNPAFVLTQYFGYLRRDPDQGGYDFWLNVLNNREPNNFRGMVCAFVTSTEYQLRFGSAVTRSNADCGR